MKRLSAGMAVLCLLADPAAAQAPRAADSSEITDPDWIQRPTAADFAPYYPELAARLGLEGRATVVCRVKDDGALSDCTAEAETPKDIGIGESAVRLASGYRMRPLTRGGKPVGGRTVRIPLRFWTPQQEPPAQTPRPIPSAASLALGRRLVDLTKGVEEVTAGFDQTALEIERGFGLGVVQSTRTSIAEAYRRAARDHAGEIREVQARAYAETFTKDELERIVAFESTRAGAFLRSTANDREVTGGLVRNLTRRVLDGVRDEFCKTWDCEVPDALLAARSGAAVDRPKWAHEPAPHERGAYAPRIAGLFGLKGFVRLRCTMADQVRPDACQIEAEAPAGLGYGAAALSTAQFYRLDSAQVRPGSAPQTVAVRIAFGRPDLSGGSADPQPPSDGALELARALAKGDGQLPDFHKRMAEPYHRVLGERPPDVSPAAFEALRAALEVTTAKATQQYVDERASLITAKLSEAEIAQAVAFVRSPTGHAWWARPKAIQQSASEGLARVAARITDDVRAAFCRDHDCPS